MRYFYFLLLGLLLTLPANAQWEARLHLGGTASTIVGDDDTDFGALARFFAGAGVGFPLTNNWAVRGEINYVVRGAKATDITTQDGAVIGEVILNHTYFHIPLLLEYRRDLAGGWRPAIYAGPSLSRKIEARNRWSDGKGGPEFQDSDDSVQKGDFGLVLGAEVGLPLRGDRLVLGVRGYAGLSNLRDSDPALKSRGAQLYAGVSF